MKPWMRSTLLWVAGTTAATAMVLFAVSQVGDVATSHGLARAVAPTGTDGVNVAPLTTMAGSGGTVDQGSALTPPITVTTGAVAPTVRPTVVTAPPPVATSAVTSAPGSPTTTRPAAGTSSTESYVMLGGAVSVSYSPTRVNVQWATPLPGYSVETQQVSPTHVVVEFVGPVNRSRLEASWDGGPRHSIQNF